MEVTCSRGTYVRTLCHDMGRAAGGCACMGMLLRTASGPFSIESAHTLEALRALAEEGQAEKALLTCEAALGYMPALKLPAERFQPARNGLPTYVGKLPVETVRLYCGDRFMGIGQVENRQVRLRVHLYDE